MLKRAVTVSFLVVIGMIGTGCASVGSLSSRGGADSDLGVSGRAPDLRGIVSSVEEGDSDGSSVVRVLVAQRADLQPEESVQEAGDGSKSAPKDEPHGLYLKITDQTRVLRKERDGDIRYLDRVEASELEEGQKIRVWHGEIVSRSYPGQAQAESIVIDRG